MIFAMLLERLRRQLLCASAASISTPGSEVVRTNQGCDLTVVPPLMRVREIAASVLRRLGAAQPRLGAGAKADEAARAASKLMVRRVMPEVLLFVHLLPCAPSAVPFFLSLLEWSQFCTVLESFATNSCWPRFQMDGRRISLILSEEGLRVAERFTYSAVTHLSLKL